MKSTLAKSAIALSILGFSFGSNLVYEQQWKPSIFRTIANAVEFEELTAENVEVEFKSFKALVTAHGEVKAKFEEKVEDEETGLSDLIEMRDKSFDPMGEESLRLLKRRGDFAKFFQENAEHPLNAEFEAVAQLLADFHPAQAHNRLLQRITEIKEREILEQKAALAATSEKLCENKDLLEDIKAQIAELLKDKEEVVAEVEAENNDEAPADDETEDGFSTDVTTYSELFAHLQEQQRSFWQLSPPAFLAPSRSPFSMLMMFSMMNRSYAAPKTQINTYYMGGFGSLGSSDDQRTPATSAPNPNDRQGKPLLVPRAHRGQIFDRGFTPFSPY